MALDLVIFKEGDVIFYLDGFSQRRMEESKGKQLTHPICYVLLIGVLFAVTTRIAEKAERGRLKIVLPFRVSRHETTAPPPPSYCESYDHCNCIQTCAE